MNSVSSSERDSALRKARSAVAADDEAVAFVAQASSGPIRNGSPAKETKAARMASGGEGCTRTIVFDHPSPRLGPSRLASWPAYKGEQRHEKSNCGIHWHVCACPCRLRSCRHRRTG